MVGYLCCALSNQNKSVWFSMSQNNAHLDTIFEYEFCQELWKCSCIFTIPPFPNGEGSSDLKVGCTQMCTHFTKQCPWLIKNPSWSPLCYSAWHMHSSLCHCLSDVILKPKSNAVFQVNVDIQSAINQMSHWINSDSNTPWNVELQILLRINTQLYPSKWHFLFIVLLHKYSFGSH